MSAPAPPRFWMRLLAFLVPPRDRDHLILELSDLYAIRHARCGRRAANRWYRGETLGFFLTRLSPFGTPRSPSPLSRPPQGAFISDLMRDLVHAIRSLARQPTFALVAITTIALGIGGSTAVFGLANWLLLRPVPGVPNSDRLGIALFAEELGGGRYSPRGISYPNYRDLLEAVPAADHLIGYQPTSIHISAEGAEPRSVSAKFVMWDYFEALGVRAIEGRTFRRTDEQSDRELTGVIVSERLWHSLLMRKSVSTTLTVRINGLETNVLGVVPSPFHGLERLSDTDVWLPGTSYGYAQHWNDIQILAARDLTLFHWFLVKAAPGAPFEQLQAQLQAGLERLSKAYPDVNDRFDTATAIVTAGIGVNPRSVATSHGIIRLLSSTVGLVILLAVANMTNLLILRGVLRRGETAVRRALGAPFHRLVRYELMESLLLALAGAAVAIPLAMLLFRLFDGISLSGVGQIQGIAVDWRLVAFAAALAASMAAVFSIGPGLMSARTDVAATMQSLRSSHTPRRPWLRESITVVQLALATTIVVSSFLLIGTMHELLHIDLGFDPEQITTFQVSPGDHGYDETEFMQYHQDLERRLTLIPGVSNVAVTDHLPLYFRFRGDFYDPSNPGDSIVATTSAVGATFFNVTRIALNAGRTFRQDEIFSGTQPTPLIISDSLAHLFFDTANPVGRTIMSPRYRSAPHQYTVVGVVANTRWDDLEEESGPLAFTPFHASYARGSRAFYVVRSQQSTTEIAPLLREAAAQIDPSLPIAGAAPLSDQVERQLADRRLLARLLTVFAAFAVLLAGVGLYGVVAFGVAERTREFGIRVALGANDGRVLGLVLRQAGVIAGIGVAVGLAGAAAFSQWLESRLFGIEPIEPTIYLGAALGLGLVALMAGMGPARRATRVDPMIALRCE